MSRRQPLPDRRTSGSDGRLCGSRLTVPAGFGAAEVHSHTLASDGMVFAEDLVLVAADIGLNVLCITDHDTLGATPRAVELGAELGVEVVAGQEVTTAMPPGSHVVGLFLEHPVRIGMSLEDTVDAIHDQGGLAILAHPFMPTWFASITPRRARRLLERRAVDGIELRHTCLVPPSTWSLADRFYAEHRERLGAALGAGDSHFGAGDLGRMVSVFPGKSAQEFRRAVESRRVSPLRGINPVGPSLWTRLRQQRRSMLWLAAERRAGRVGRGLGPVRLLSGGAERASGSSPPRR